MIFPYVYDVKYENNGLKSWSLINSKNQRTDHEIEFFNKI